MKQIKLKLKNNNKSLEILIAKSHIARLIGLQFHKKLKYNQGLLLMNSNWIHNLFVFQTLTLIYLDKNFKVIDIQLLKPFALALPRFNAKHVLELSDDFLKYYKVKIGDKIKI
jgi:uncharacterized protein